MTSAERDDPRRPRVRERRPGIKVGRYREKDKDGEGFLYIERGMVFLWEGEGGCVGRVELSSGRT